MNTSMRVLGIVVFTICTICTSVQAATSYCDIVSNSTTAEGGEAVTFTVSLNTNGEYGDVTGIPLDLAIKFPSGQTMFFDKVPMADIQQVDMQDTMPTNAGSYTYGFYIHLPGTRTPDIKGSAAVYNEYTMTVTEAVGDTGSTQVETLQAQITTLQSENSTLQGQLTTANSTISDLQTQLENCGGDTGNTGGYSSTGMRLRQILENEDGWGGLTKVSEGFYTAPVGQTVYIWAILEDTEGNAVANKKALSSTFSENGDYETLDADLIGDPEGFSWTSTQSKPVTITYCIWIYDDPTVTPLRFTVTYQ